MEDYAIKNFRLRDSFEVARAISDTWNLETDITNKFVLKTSSLAYLYYMLAKSNYSKLLFDDKKIAAVLFARNEHKLNFLKIPRLLIMFLLTFFLLLTKEGKNLYRYQLDYNRVSDSLLSKNNKSYDGEAVLLFSLPCYKGKGYGSILLNNYKSYMNGLGYFNLYLITDDYCNYKFYDKMGYQLVGTEGDNFNFINIDFFQNIYIYEFDRQEI